MATNAKDLTTAEVAYAAINEADKVSYIRFIKDIPLREVRAAEMALLAGNVKDAEGVLLQNGLVFRAIMMHLQLFHWEK
jgi:intraflagellar transport protein 80